MADNSGGNSFLGFIVGGLLIAVIAIGLFVFAGGNLPGNNTKTVDLNIDAPKIEAPSVPSPGGGN